MGSFRVGILALLLAASACSSTEPGLPAAQAGNGTATTKAQAPSTTTSVKSQSTRPKTIDLRAFDPCRIMEKIRPEVGLPEKPLTPEKSVAFPGSATCIQTTAGSGPSLQVLPILNLGLADYAGSYLVSSPLTLEGFPALLLEGNYQNDCYVGVDVADGQTFSVQWTITLPNGKPAMSDVCAAASKAAAAAMKVLVAS